MLIMTKSALNNSKEGKVDCLAGSLYNHWCILLQVNELYKYNTFIKDES